MTPHQGQVFKLGKVDIVGLPAGFKAPVTIKPGQVALAAPILDAGPVLQSALHNAGYAFAKVSSPLAVAEPAAHRLDVTFTVTAGPKVDIGPLAFEGLGRTNEAFLLRHMTLKPGQPYSDTALATARDSLLGLGVFSSVTPVPEDHLLPNGQVPILFRVTPRDAATR